MTKEEIKETIRELLRQELCIEVSRFDDYYLEIDLVLGKEVISTTGVDVPYQLRNNES